MALSIARDYGPEERLMSQEMELRHLELANRHIAEGEHRIAEQKARIARLERNGRDTTASKKLLNVFEETLELMMRHRGLILREIKRLTTLELWLKVGEGKNR